MSLVVVVPPEPIVALSAAKAWLKVESGDDDDLITDLVASAVGELDGPDGWLGRALGRQTLKLTTDGFIGRHIRLPCPPIISVESVAYLDWTGVSATVMPERYETVATGIAPVWGAIWPAARARVDITYVAGYASGQVPSPILTAVRMRVADLYANREASLIDTGRGSAIENPTVAALLTPLRVHA